ncbi:hypothetical protein NEOLI_005501 [Neolecta irregularis DAH-3]|uniref:Uncharacterized protein n=1 Tax=Neolecta irregularis (strain DAH-3) TaxID=1198029 RepID=A0A1U7LGJ4_NEOID|nr:hypothetical protein NEOLI_005501 [Neolecta irregularis DAH-3]|eukprot:OLL21774.1 hypothetical protein NEOLI_005501 [Neolecta irregularis DAH-3]
MIWTAAAGQTSRHQLGLLTAPCSCSRDFCAAPSALASCHRLRLCCCH